MVRRALAVPAMTQQIGLFTTPSIKDFLTFVGDMPIEKFVEDRKIVNAVIRSLEIVGEAAKKVPADVRQDYPDVPWKEIAGMRDKLIHEYFGVDLDIIWETVQNDLSALDAAVSDFIQGKI